MSRPLEEVAVDIDRVGRRARATAAPPLMLTGSDESTVGARLAGALPHADVDTISARGRATSVKRVVLRVSRLFLAEQAAFNRDLWQAVAELNHQVMVLRSQVAGLSSEIEQLRAVEASRHATATLRMDELEGRLDGAALAVPDATGNGG